MLKYLFVSLIVLGFSLDQGNYAKASQDFSQESHDVDNVLHQGNDKRTHAEPVKEHRTEPQHSDENKCPEGQIPYKNGQCIDKPTDGRMY